MNQKDDIYKQEATLNERFNDKVVCRTTLGKTQTAIGTRCIALRVTS